ncbi:MAG: ACT domain-containing protein [Sedimentisphaerales bacterium]|nr:ACT domain-containing protein [Sedimentisphaerales bacterium]
MHIATQFSIFLINKPGILAQVLNALAKAKVNIVAMTMMDSVEHGVLRLVAAQPEHARDILKHISVQVNETEVLCVTLSNKPGALADVATQLSKVHVNINYCYVTAGARGGKTTGVLKVADLPKAIRVLEKTGTQKKIIAGKKQKKLRPAPSHRSR